MWEGREEQVQYLYILSCRLKDCIILKVVSLHPSTCFWTRSEPRKEMLSPTSWELAQSLYLTPACLQRRSPPFSISSGTPDYLAFLGTIPSRQVGFDYWDQKNMFSYRIYRIKPNFSQAISFRSANGQARWWTAAPCSAQPSPTRQDWIYKIMTRQDVMY